MPRYSPAGSFDGLACLLAFALDLLLKGLCLSPVHSFISRSFFFFSELTSAHLGTHLSPLLGHSHWTYHSCFGLFTFL